MKRVICFLLLVLFITPASAEGFLDDFNNNADYWGISHAGQFNNDGEIYYMSGLVLIYEKEDSVTVCGTDVIKTLAVACCAIDSMELSENYEIAGRVFTTYLQAVNSETHEAYSTLQNFKVNFYIAFQNDMIVVGLLK